jgi:tetratricopeptide (TPR) repeat protein
LRQLPADNILSITTLLNNLAIVYRRLDKYDSAIEALTEALAFKRELNDQIGLPSVLGNLAQLLAHQGDMARAEAYIREGLELRTRLQDRPGMLHSLEQMAELLHQKGRADQAVRLFATTACQRQLIHLPMTAQVEAERVEKLRQLRAELGETTFMAAWETGEGMTLETAVQTALAANEK